MKIPKSGNKLKGLDKPSKQQPAPTKSKVIGRHDESDEESDTDDELASRMRRGAGISVPGSEESERTRILSVLELEDLFMSHAPEGASFPFFLPSP